MKKNNIFLIFSFFTPLLLCSFYSNAQLQADFTASVTAGCAPFAVQFLDASRGNPSEWNWDFGNGDSSVQQDPAVVFRNAGFYNIRLTIKDILNQSTIVKNAFINVYANPEIGINIFHHSGCIPFTPYFSSSSLAGSGVITNWVWSFGDGSYSNDSAVAHTYNSIGTFNVSLTAKNTYGCEATLQQPGIIKVFTTVKADFDYFYSDACLVPLPVQFSPTNNNATYYQWHFGDGTSSTVVNPSHDYNLPGLFKAELIAKTDPICYDTSIKTIIVGAPLANFILPKSICQNTPLLFQDSSAPKPFSVRWDFGDGNTASGSNVYHTYTNNGTYQIKMIADFGRCTATQEKTIIVAGKSQASFTASGNLKSCSLPQTISFNNQSSEAVSYQWLFGDGTSSNNSDPVHQYTKAGNYSVTLIAINANGCADTSTKNNLIQLNPVQITGLQKAPFTSCAPGTIFFKPLINTSDPVVSYQWSFGDGSGSNQANPSHYYAYVGSYTVSLNVVTQTGCRGSFALGNAVALGNKPTVSFNASPLDACASTVVNFKDSSSGILTSWLWDFGDDDTSTLQNPQHQYADTGYYTIKLVVSANGCGDSVTKTKFVHIKPPVGNFYFKVDCNDHFAVNFTNTSIEGETFLWDFGDSITSTQENPYHRYSQADSFLVSLTTFNTNGCSYTKDSIVYISEKNQKVTYEPNSSDICKFDTVKFKVSNYDHNVTSYFNWNFGDSSLSGFLPTITDSIFHVFTAAGNYQPYLIIQNIYACFDTIYIMNAIKVFGPTASFLANPAACRDSLVTFDDRSIPYQNYPITAWSWDFGDGTAQNFTSSPFTHAYSSTGVYAVKLKVTDSKGCYDSAYIISPIQISKSTLDAGMDSAICPGDSSILQASGANSYTWRQDNSLSCTVCANPMATPNVTTVYYVSGTNAKGCTSQDSVTVEVKQPITIQLNNADTLCAGTTKSLTATGAELYQWVPSDNSQVLYGSAVNVSPHSTVTYTVIGTDSIGCFSDTSQIALQVYPYPTISFPNSLVVITAGSEYQIQPTISADATQFLWSPITGLSCSNCPSPVAQPKATTTYTLQASNPGDCSTRQSVTIQVICKDQQIFIPNTFSPNGDGMNDVFFPRGKGIYSVRSFRVFNRLGQVVFERINLGANDPANGWNGNYQGKPANSDVYIYQIDVLCENNQVISIKGNVTLLR